MTLPQLGNTVPCSKHVDELVITLDQHVNTFSYGAAAARKYSTLLPIDYLLRLV